MPDIRLRPGTIGPSDVGLVRGEGEPVNLVLRAVAGTDVVLVPRVLPPGAVAAVSSTGARSHVVVIV